MEGGDGRTLIRVKYRGEEVLHPAPGSSSTLHRALAARFNIPVSRMKLILRGKAYPETKSDELVAAAAQQNAPAVFVLGTSSQDQLDSPAVRARQGRQWLFNSATELPFRIWALLCTIFSFVLHFFTTMISPPQRRNDGEQQQQQQQQQRRDRDAQQRGEHFD